VSDNITLAGLRSRGSGLFAPASGASDEAPTVQLEEDEPFETVAEQLVREHDETTADIDAKVTEAKAGGRSVFHDPTPPAPAPPAKPKYVKRNRYGAPCVNCGQRVEAEAGLLLKGLQGWEVSHETCPPKPEAKPATTKPRRRNQYGQDCELCGRRVEPEEGWLERSDEGKWAVFHDGTCPSSFPFPEGRYALVEVDGAFTTDAEMTWDGERWIVDTEVHFYNCFEDGEVYARQHRAAPPQALHRRQGHRCHRPRSSGRRRAVRCARRGVLHLPPPPHPA
jgi:hypothetical protein